MESKDPLLEDEEEDKEDGNQEKEQDNGDDFVNTMIDDVVALYKTGRLSDVIFYVGKEKEVIRAHKLILASASPIFEQMLFPNELQQNPKSWVSQMQFHLPDVDPQSFKILMQAIYTDQVEINSKILPGALALARRYCCEKLQLECTDFLEEGVNEQNVCNFFNHGEEIAGDPNFGLSFILKKTKKVFATEGFLELFPDRLASLLGNQELSCREAYLFEKLIAWGEAKVDADDDDSSDPKLVRKYIGDLLQYIRFPLMNFTEFTKVVSRSDLLVDEDLIELYAYIAARDGKIPEEELPALNPKWNTAKRGSSGGAFTFKWLKCGRNSTIEDDGLTHRSHASGYSCAIADTSMPPESGSYYWEIKVKSCSTSSWQCALGVATQQLNLDNYLSSTTAGWAYFNMGCRAHNSGSGSDYYGQKWGNAGEVLGCHYNSDEGTVSFYFNGKNQGVCFTGIKEEVWPASHVNTSVTIAINDDIETVLTDP